MKLLISRKRPSFVASNLVTIINASAAATLLEQRPEEYSGSERDSNPRPLRYRCSAFPTESGRMRVSPLYLDVILGPSIVKSEINFVH